MSRKKMPGECTTWPPKGETMVDLQSCPSAGHSDCSSLGVDLGHRGEEEAEMDVIRLFS